MIEAVKHNEQARKEYRIMSAFEMDAREEGVQQGIRQGFADGSYRKALEDAGNLKQLGVSIDIIAKATGLSKEEVEALKFFIIKNYELWKLIGRIDV